MSQPYRGYYDITEDIIVRLKAAGCSVVTFGDTPDYMRNQKNPVTPGAHVSPVGFSSDNVDRVQLQIWVYDLTTMLKLDKKQSEDPIYGENNTVDNLDTTKAIIDSFIRQIQGRTIGLNNGGYYRVTTSPQWNAEYEEGNVRVSGWVGTINITMMTYASSCDVTDTSVLIPGASGAPFVRIDGSTPFTAPQTGVPATELDQLVTLSQLSNASGNTKTIISGGVTWTGTGLTFDVSAIEYDFFGTIGTTTATQLTNDDGDSQPRFDSFVVDVEANEVVIVKGIPDTNPALPEIGISQIFIQAVQINAGATVPDIDQDFAYRDNADWTTSTYTVGSPSPGTVDFESTDDPFQGTFCIQSNTSRSTGIRLQRVSSIALGTGDGEFSNLSFAIRFDTALPSNRNLLSSVWLSGSTVGNTVNLSSFGVNRNIVGTWQQIVVPTSAFGANNIDRIQIRMDGGNNTQQVQYFLDFIVFSSGILQPSQVDVVTIVNNGTVVATRPKINFVNATTIVDDPVNDQVTVTLPAGGGGGGGVDSVVAGTGIAVDDTDPANPIVSSTVTPGGQVDSVVAGTNVSVDNTDPANPIVSANDTTNHAVLSNLSWTASGHTGTANRVPVFGSGGAAELAQTTGNDAKLVSGTEGTNGNLVEWAASGNARDSGISSDDVVTPSILTGTTRQYTKAQNLTNVALSIVSNETAFDTTLSNSYTLDMTANTELQLPTVDVPGTYQIRVFNNGGNTLTFATGYRVLGDTPSTTDTEYILVNIACFGDDTPWAVVNNQP